MILVSTHDVGKAIKTRSDVFGKDQQEHVNGVRLVVI